ncbi:hypothetical protein BUALT_Bualt12G0059500 [Buddleja alternifolia]|uniref:Fe2OG dioxygenase domain-containing protein n=1 Tax=Buddleja alternifolia TaxID=168488 RepID=A0AAV6WPF0_9LAMI|nr:hypothetical protein BUALT_Bualt12G0059500 [Buddleja alternifolia]
MALKSMQIFGRISIAMPTSDKFESYPPLFRPNQTVDHGENPTNKLPKSASDYKLESQSDYVLPVIDFEHINPQNLSEVCREWGMFRLINHGVPDKLLKQLIDQANQLFSLSFESKQALFNSPLLYFWGTPALILAGNALQTDPHAQNHNWLEGLNVPLIKLSEFQCEDQLIQSFSSLLEEYGNHQTRLAKTIFNTMAEDLNFPPTKSESYLSPPTGFLRVYRYLRCPIAEQRWGIEEHTDSSVVTILHQDQVGGLQVYKDNKWLDVEPIHDTLIVNLGDMMQAMSNDEYVSAKHRVRVNMEQERISFGYFIFPGEGSVIESPKYKPFTFDDFRAQKELDLKTTGIKIGLPRFRIGDEQELPMED